MSEWLEHSVHTVIDEGEEVPVDGIDFDVPPDQVKKCTKTLLAAIRRLHINTGHPPNAQLERIVRLSGGSEVATAACKGLKCSICAKA